MESSHNLSKKLKNLRTSRGMTQTEFASEIGISKSTLQEIEHGKSPTLETLSCISSRLGVPIPVLLSDSIPPTQLSIVIQLIHAYDWFSKCSAEEQDELLRILQQVSHSLSILKESQGDKL